MAQIKEPGPGNAVVAYLRDPRGQNWGILLKVDPAGIWFRGVELNAFEDLARSIAAGKTDRVSVSTVFIPLLRIEKIVIDEDYASIPSLSRRFEEMTGRTVEFLLSKEE